MRILVSWALGLVFGLGLVVSGMVNPEKVRNFLDIAGAWDPSLLLVLGSAVIVTLVGYRLTSALLERPLLGDAFHFPTRREITPRLVVGALIFGVGWGLGGLCPAPAESALLVGPVEIWVFLVAMLVGMWFVEHGLPRLVRWEHHHELHH